MCQLVHKDKKLFIIDAICFVLLETGYQPQLLVREHAFRIINQPENNSPKAFFVVYLLERPVKRVDANSCVYQCRLRGVSVPIIV